MSPVIVGGAVVVLLAAAFPFPLAAADACSDSRPSPACAQACPPTAAAALPGEPSGDDCVKVVTSSMTPNCFHTSPHSHTYWTSGSFRGRSRSAGTGQAGTGSTTVYETNVKDCNKDGVPWDFDGDYETGVGGAFFGFGAWAHEPICEYYLMPHGDTVTVTDVVFGSEVEFVIGADDTSGPTIDPRTGECSTDGGITPGDPATDPTADADDCLTATYVGNGATCGAGGDGGYWVFLAATRAHEGGGAIGVSNIATAGLITA